jgi:hypothetical protein
MTNSFDGFNAKKFTNNTRIIGYPRYSFKFRG